MKSKGMLLGAAVLAVASVFAEDYSTWWQMDTSDNKQWRQSSYTRENWFDPAAAEPVLQAAEADNPDYR